MKNRLVPYILVLLAAASWLPAPAAEVERRERGALVLENVPEIPDQVAQRLEQYRNTRSASFGGWHPAGEGVLVTTRFGETDQVHWVQGPGLTREQLTFFDEPVRGVRVSPRAETGGFLFSKDVGGSEFYQIFFQELATGRYRMLTDGRSRNAGASWSRAGTRLAFSSTRRNGRDYDIWIADYRKPQEARSVLSAGGAWFALDWSPDDRLLAVSRYVSANESYPHLLDLESGELTPIHDGEQKVAYGDTVFAPDGKGLYFTSDRDSEVQKLRYYEIATGETRTLTEWSPWDVEEVAVAPSGNFLTYTINEDGISKLYVVDQRAEKIFQAELPAGLISDLDFRPGADEVAFVLETPQSPEDVHSLRLDETLLRRWTRSEVGGLDTEQLVRPELIRYPTFDRVDGEARTIPAFYYRPEGPGPFPVVVDIHGGPEGQRRPYFNPLLQYYVRELGIAVLHPNVRGSAGYGKSYLLLDNGFKREDSVRDIGALLDWIATRPELDAGRVAVQGGSYGGYMVLASMVSYGERLRAGIDRVGISNFVTFLENTQEYRRDLRRAEYGDERNPKMREFLEKISPLTRAGEIRKPLFVVQGLNDPRVPVTESEQMVAQIRENGGQVWYMLARDEGHGLSKKSNRDFFQAAASLFLEEFLLPGGRSAETPNAP